MEAKHHTSEKPTNHRRNKRRNLWPWTKIRESGGNKTLSSDVIALVNFTVLSNLISYKLAALLAKAHFKKKKAR